MMFAEVESSLDPDLVAHGQRTARIVELHRAINQLMGQLLDEVAVADEDGLVVDVDGAMDIVDWLVARR